MKVLLVPVTPFQQNCSILVDEATGKAAVVDPGGDLERIEEVLAKTGATLEKILATAEIKQSFNNVGLEPWWMPAEQLDNWLREDVEKWQKVTRAIKFQPE